MDGENKQDPPPYPGTDGYGYPTTAQPNATGFFPPGQVTTVIIQPNLGPESQRMNCPHCMADISTHVKYSDGRMTHILAIVLCVVGCWPCCLIPYCVDGCKDAEHTCPSCQRHIGNYRR